MRIGWLSFILLFVVGISQAQHVENCHKITEQEVMSLFERWNNSLASGDPQKVVDNYLDDAILLPTVSNQIRLTQAERLDYFKHFLEKAPHGKIDYRMIKIGCNKAVDAGHYTFNLNDKSTIAARYTFVYKWDGQKWLISLHHSSLMPQ